MVFLIDYWLSVLSNQQNPKFFKIWGFVLFSLKPTSGIQLHKAVDRTTMFTFYNSMYLQVDFEQHSAVI